MNKKLLQDLNAVYNGLNEDLHESKILLGNIIDKLEQVINYTSCCTQLKDKNLMVFKQWRLANGFTEINGYYYKNGDKLKFEQVRQIYLEYVDSF